MLKKVNKKVLFWMLVLWISVLGYLYVLNGVKKKDIAFTVDEEKMLNLLKEYVGDEIPNSATEPHVLFADAKSGMVVFGRGERTMIFATEDGGFTWKQTAIPSAGETWHAVVTCAVAIDAKSYCVGYRYWGINNGVNLYLTKDRGESWLQLTPETVLPEEITDNMRYAEVVEAVYADGIFSIQISCKTISGVPWSIEVKLASEDIGNTWEIVKVNEKLTDME